MLDYTRYLDKVYGCWLGKCIVGTVGAPYEGMKQLLHLEFDEKMIAACSRTTTWIYRCFG